ncbi:MAG: lysophospholipid acyltransferase family protein [Patescibacteria group bacterium]
MTAYPLSRNILGPLLKRRLVRVQGLGNLPHSGPFLVVANHIGYQDPILMATALVLHTHRKIHAIAKWKIFRIPLFKKWTGIILLSKDRSKTFDAATHAIDQGGIVMIYPEGTHNFSDTIRKTKTGDARIAISTGCVVIPTGIRRVAPPPKNIFCKYAEIFTGRMEVFFGEPLQFKKQKPEDITREYIHDIHNQIMIQVATLAKKDYVSL